MDLLKLSKDAKEEEFHLSRTVEQIFEIFDKDKNLMLDFEEFSSFIMHESFDYLGQEEVLKLKKRWSKFDVFIKMEEGKNQLRAFLKKDLSDENIDFILEVEDFEVNPSSDKATKLFDLYISSSASRQLNLPGNIYNDCVKKIKLMKFNSRQNSPINIDAHTFDDVKNYALQLILGDSFIRFLDTEYFLLFLRHIYVKELI